MLDGDRNGKTSPLNTNEFEHKPRSDQEEQKVYKQWYTHNHGPAEIL